MTMLRPSLWRRIVNSWNHSRRRVSYTIDLTAEGFIHARRGRETEMKWAEIDRIDAGLLDCLTFDIVYFRLFAGNRSIYVEELDDGFRQFENAICGRWPQVREKWEELSRADLHQAQVHTLWRRNG